MRCANSGTTGGMMPKKPPIGKRFVPGVSGNPKGAAMHNQELKAIRKLTKQEIAEVATLLLDGNVDGLKDISKDKVSSVLKVWICSVALKAIERGDAHALTVLLDRIVGKVKDELEVTLPKPTIIEFSGDRKIILGSELPDED